MKGLLMRPKVSYPTFNIELPLSKQEITMRVMNLREEKILLTAQEGNDVFGLMDAMMTCLNNCMITENVNLMKIPFVELQYMYLQLRANSVGNVSKILIPDEYEDWIRHDVLIKIDDVDLKFDPDSDLKIMFTDDSGMIMRLPNFKDAYRINKEQDTGERVLLFIRLCVESIFDSDNVYPENSFTDDELAEYIDSLPSTYFDMIKRFLENFPRIEYRVEYTNSKGEPRKLVLRSLENFIQ